MAHRTLIDGSIEIDAPPADVWAVVSDLRRMGEWSPQCQRMVVFGGAVKQGTRTLNINQQGWARWPTTAKVVAFEPVHRIAFRIDVNRTVWTYELEPTAGGGTRVTESRTTPDGVPGITGFASERLFGGTDDFEESLQRGIAKTLERIKTEVENHG